MTDDVEDDMYVYCPDCGESFETEEEVDTHIKDEHGIEQ